jgi:hypothetical protein
MNITHFYSRTWIFRTLMVLVVLFLAGGMLMLVTRGRSASAEQNGLVSLESTYAGTVELDWVSQGVFSDTLTEPAGPPPDLGSIDLGFLLHHSEYSLNGYVDLDSTLVFTTEHTISTIQAVTPLAVGPQVVGTFAGDSLQLESERFSSELFGLDTERGQIVTRQFRLTGVKTGLTTYTGEYRETLWGYGPQVYTIVGEFELNLISGKNLALPYELYMPVVQR